jgi:anti-sigma factor RsiW
MNNLTCEEFVEMVTDHLDGALDPEAQRRFAGHVPTCPGCSRYLSQFRVTIHMLARHHDRQPTPGRQP